MLLAILHYIIEIMIGQHNGLVQTLILYPLVQLRQLVLLLLYLFMFLYTCYSNFNKDQIEASIPEFTDSSQGSSWTRSAS